MQAATVAMGMPPVAIGQGRQGANNTPGPLFAEAAD